MFNPRPPTTGYSAGGHDKLTMIMARLILLTEWAKDEFSAPVPTPSTLSKYAKAGMIFPLPKKVGRHWRVDPEARFVGMIDKPIVNETDHPIIKRILGDGSPTKI